MMSRRLLVVNAVLALIAIAAIGSIVRELRVKPTPVATRPAPVPAPVVASAAAPETPPGGYGTVATRNLFSPTRSESTTPTASAAASLPKPNLFGILLRDAAPVAYLEDPTTKRVAAYRLGDSIAGGTVKQITADQVVLNRPEGDVNVRLRDPSKPRPAPVATSPAQPGAAPPPGVRALPPGTVVTQPSVPPGGQMVQSPGAPGSQVPPTLTPVPQETPPVLPRRPLPPNLLRRLPPATPDAPAQQ
jgi:hypothetical protein